MEMVSFLLGPGNHKVVISLATCRPSLSEKPQAFCALEFSDGITDMPDGVCVVHNALEEMY